jgi:hypothetical protein
MDKIQRIESLPDFLAAEGLEIVRGEWLRGSPYPVLFVRPKAPPALDGDGRDGAGPVGVVWDDGAGDVLPPALCVCPHTWAQHDQEGCLECNCKCPAAPMSP